MELTQFEMTKRDCVREEIHGAIRVLAWDGNFVAAHVLASAATEILDSIARKTGVSSLQIHFEAMTKPERHKEIRKILKSPYNYMKHADRDANEPLEKFSAESALWQTLIACYDYFQVYGNQSFAMVAFMSWMGFLYPDIMAEEAKDMSPFKMIDMKPDYVWTNDLETLRFLCAEFFEQRESFRSQCGSNEAKFDWAEKTLRGEKRNARTER